MRELYILVRGDLSGILSTLKEYVWAREGGAEEMLCAWSSKAGVSDGSVLSLQIWARAR